MRKTIFVLAAAEILVLAAIAVSRFPLVSSWLVANATALLVVVFHRATSASIRWFHKQMSSEILQKNLVISPIIQLKWEMGYMWFTDVTVVRPQSIIQRLLIQDVLDVMVPISYVDSNSGQISGKINSVFLDLGSTPPTRDKFGVGISHRFPLGTQIGSVIYAGDGGPDLIITGNKDIIFELQERDGLLAKWIFRKAVTNGVWNLTGC